jgi:hypothetical protein
MFIELYNSIYDYVLKHHSSDCSESKLLKELKYILEIVDCEKEKFQSILLRIKYFHNEDIGDRKPVMKRLSSLAHVQKDEKKRPLLELRKQKTNVNICRFSERKLAQKEELVLLISK